MSLTNDDVRYVARLARLQLPDNSLPALKGTLNRVLDYVAQLQTLNTDQVEPTMHVLPMNAPLREDSARASLPVESVVKNAPHVVDNMFVVPRIMDDEGGTSA